MGGVCGTLQSLRSAVRISRVVSLLWSPLVADDADGRDSLLTEVRGGVSGASLPTTLTPPPCRCSKRWPSVYSSKWEKNESNVS